MVAPCVYRRLDCLVGMIILRPFLTYDNHYGYLHLNLPVCPILKSPPRRHAFICSLYDVTCDVVVILIFARRSAQLVR